MGHVFVSHSSEDASLAHALVAALETGGVTCWIAPRDIVPGVEYMDAVDEAVATAGVVVVLLSQAAAESARCRSELNIAEEEDVPIVPVRLDGTKPRGGLRFLLGTSQWLDGTRSVSDPWVGTLHASVRYLLDRPPASAPPPPGPTSLPDPPTEAIGSRPAVTNRGDRRSMPDDDPRWAQRSGGQAHDDPDWTVGDVEALVPLVAGSPARLRRFLEVLSAAPGVEFTADELAVELGLGSAAGLAGALSPFNKWGGSGRSFPFKWWKGKPSTYAMTHQTAEAIRVALERTA